MWPAPRHAWPAPPPAPPAVLAAEYVVELATRREPDLATVLALKRLLRTANAGDPPLAEQVEASFAALPADPVLPVCSSLSEPAADLNADIALLISHAASLAVTDPTGAMTLLRAVAPVQSPELVVALAQVQLGLAAKLRAAGLVHESRTLASEATAMAPHLPAAHIALAELAADPPYADLPLAEKHYRAAVALDPVGTLDAQVALAVVLRSQHDLNGAVAVLEGVLAIDRDSEPANAQLAVTLCDLATAIKGLDESQLKEVRSMYKRALVADPNYPEGHYNLAVAYAEANKPDRARTHYALAITTRKARYGRDYPEAHNNLGVLAKTQGNPVGAITHYARAIDAAAKVIADPSDLSLTTAGILHQIHNNMAVVLTLLGRTSQARSHLEQALVLEPRYVEGHNNVGVLCREEGKFREALDAYSRARLCAKARAGSEADQIFPSPGDMASQNRLHMLNYDLDVYSGDQIFAEHQNWGIEFEAKIRARYPDTASRSGRHRQTWTRERQKGSKPPGNIRIGLLSGDFFTHSVSYFAECLLTFDAEKSGIEVYVYSNTPTSDAKTCRLRAYSAVENHWRDICGVQTDEVSEMVMKDKIDILFDLAGHTAGNRLDVMALQPAPVQATWIGYPNTTGMSAIDYRVTDDKADPRWTSQQFSEKLYRLPDVFLCYTAGTDFPEVMPLPVDRQSDGFITFGSFNILAKMRPAAVAVWATLLRRVPKSRLLLKAKALADASCQQRIESMFYGQGVCPSRLCLMPMTPTTQAHLDLYGQVDIGLDPFPYAGTTTTCEALYMGVPVVTLATSTGNEFHAQNVGASLLSCIGQEGLVTRTEEQFVDVAQELSRDIPRLRRLRSELRSDMMASPLGNRERYLSRVADMCRHLVDSKLKDSG